MAKEVLVLSEPELKLVMAIRNAAAVKEDGKIQLKVFSSGGKISDHDVSDLVDEMTLESLYTDDGL